MAGDIRQIDIASALKAIPPAALDWPQAAEVTAEIARTMGQSANGYWRMWWSLRGGEPDYATDWERLTGAAVSGAPIIERLAREAGWLPLSEQDRSGVSDTMREEARAGVYAAASGSSVQGAPEYEGPPPEAYEGNGDAAGPLLPPWEAVEATDPPARAPSLIEGVLRRGHVGIVSAKAKAGKSWAAIALAVAVATGGEWLGFPCGLGRVLFVDPEVDRRSLSNRFREVADAMGADRGRVERGCARWSLRGVLTARGEPPTVADLAHDLELSGERFDLVIIDSVSVFVRGDENSSTDVRRLFAEVLRVCEVTGAAAMLVHHEGKALSGDREASDRSRGSSVWMDAPDLSLSLVETFPPSGEPSDFLQTGERAYVLECAGIREFGGFDPPRLIWRWPVFVRDAEGVTADWKPRSSQQKGGRATGAANGLKSEVRKYRCLLALAGAFIHEQTGADGMSAKDAAEAVSEAMGEPLKPATLKGYVEDCETFEVWQKSPQRWFVVPARPPAAGRHLTA